jgi:hypothetical protein
MLKVSRIRHDIVFEYNPEHARHISSLDMILFKQWFCEMGRDSHNAVNLGQLITKMQANQLFEDVLSSQRFIRLSGLRVVDFITFAEFIETLHLSDLYRKTDGHQRRQLTAELEPVPSLEGGTKKRIGLNLLSSLLWLKNSIARRSTQNHDQVGSPKSLLPNTINKITTLSVFQSHNERYGILASSPKQRPFIQSNKQVVIPRKPILIRIHAHPDKSS